MGASKKQLVAFVDDQEDLAKSLAEKYSNLYQTVPFTYPQEALSSIDESYAAVVADHRMPGMTGVDLLAKLRAKTPHTTRILLTAVADLIPLLTLINEAKVFHYVPKDPLGIDNLNQVLADAVDLHSLHLERERRVLHLQQKNAALEALVRIQTSDERSFDDLLGNDPKLLAAIRKARWAANNEMRVLITGESGTGKEDLARAIHFQGKRKTSPFKKENCSMFQPELMQAALFGTVEGAFTGAKTAKGILRDAEGGTVFLDEIGELIPQVQAFLLAFLDNGDIHPVGHSGAKNPKADVRIIAATNRDLFSEIGRGHFRLDLFHRINEVSIHLPPLRDRRDDIPLLTKRAVFHAAHKLGIENISIAPPVFAYLQSLPYPGNVRELFNIVKHAMANMQMDSTNTMDMEHICAASETRPDKAPGCGSLAEAVDAFKKQHISDVLNRHSTRVGAAEELGVDVRTLFNLTKKLEISMGA